MNPIAVFRHAATEGPGHFSNFLDARDIPWRLIALDAGDPVPESPRDYSGLVFMGGAMSANDALPWIAPSLALIRRAVDADIPVLGHCLGGQLIAKALGGEVTGNPVKEIGWGVVHVTDDPAARHWFGDLREFQAFHWHGETFSIPPAAVRILASEYCANQAYALGKHLGMQCHVEMTAAMIESWCEAGAEEIAAARSPAVQRPARILADMPAHLPGLTQTAERLYTRWLEGVQT